MHQKTRFHIFKRDNFRCQYCGRSSDETVLELDHLVPRSEGGTNDEDNLITSCRLCNKQKSNHEIVENIYAKEQKEISDIDYEHCIITLEFKSKIYNKKIEITSDSVLQNVTDITNKERFFHNLMFFMHLSSYKDTDMFLYLLNEICGSNIPKDILNFQPLSFGKDESEEEISFKLSQRNIEIWHKICELSQSAKDKAEIYNRGTNKTKKTH